MLKLMKYESLRKIRLLLIALVVIGITELAIIYTIYKGGYALGFTIMLIALLGFGGLIFLLIDSITMYSSDLYKRPGYMLFLTPNNSFKIIGSKLLISLLEGTIGIAIYISLLFANYKLIYSIYFNDPASEARMILDFFTSLTQFPSAKDMIMLVISFVVGWFSLILTIYLAITIRKTLLSNVKFGGIFSFIFFLILQFVIYYIQFKLLGNVDSWSYSVNENVSVATYSLTSLIYSGITGIILYISSSMLLSKGVDL